MVRHHIGAPALFFKKLKASHAEYLAEGLQTQIHQCDDMILVQIIRIWYLWDGCTSSCVPFGMVSSSVPEGIDVVVYL